MAKLGHDQDGAVPGMIAEDLTGLNVRQRFSAGECDQPGALPISHCSLIRSPVGKTSRKRARATAAEGFIKAHRRVIKHLTTPTDASLTTGVVFCHSFINNLQKPYQYWIHSSLTLISVSIN